MRRPDPTRPDPKVDTMSSSDTGPVDGNARVEAAFEQLRLGRGVIVFDDSERENEGDLIYAAEHMTADSMAFVIRHSSGLVCVGMEGQRLDELGLPPMVEAATDPRGTAFTCSVDLMGVTTTGISAADRTATVRALAHPGIDGDQFPATSSRSGPVPVVSCSAPDTPRRRSTSVASQACSRSVSSRRSPTWTGRWRGCPSS
jgi:3,4-dihydroxy-2-butanone 4-phosphate synthase